jgi:hypothetical protein
MALSKIETQALDVGQIGGRRNLIINGAMQVAQRGTSSTGGGYNTVDRFELTKNNLDQMGTTTTQSTDAPTGFANALKLVGSPAETAIAADERVYFRYKFEGQDLQQLKKGTADAVSVTLSFWVKSDVTGNYAVKLEDTDNTRSIGSTYTISSADTWEYKTLTFAGDTTGALDNDNNTSLRIDWYLMAGSDYTSTDNTSWGAHVTGKSAYGHTASFGTTDNDNWQITGVQLEVGSVATPFEHRSYGEELLACQRYFVKFGSDATSVQLGFGMSGAGSSNGHVMTPVVFPVTLRAMPADADVTYDNVQVCTGAACWTATKVSAVSLSTQGCVLQTSGTATLTNYETNLPYFQTKTGGGGISFDVEL